MHAAMKVIVLLALALSATAAAAQTLPVLRTGPCPFGYRPAGSYCIALDADAAPAIPAPPNNGPCPYGYARQNGYCIKP
jgi:hypothetical protein